MVIVASLSGRNLFSSLPSTPPASKSNPANNTATPSPPIPIPKYPPPRRSLKSKKPPPEPPKPTSNNPGLKHHRNSKYYKPVKDGVISSEGDRSVVIGESGLSYLLPGAPFEFQFSYSETPKVKPLAIREPAFLPFAPPTMPRPWTGKAPLKSSKKKIPLFDSFNPSPPGTKGMKHVEMPGPFPAGKYPQEGKTRKEILGEPLKRWEIRMLVKPMVGDNRQVNLGRDGLTHNMLDLIHSHWKRSRVCKVRCKGVPTIDMDNVCYHLEEKTGGKIIHRVAGVIYLFRGRNYNYRTRPQYPLMLWKPAAPVYPKLIQEAPEGLTKAEADGFRKKGKRLLPICKLAKNGVYVTLVKDVRHAFEASPLVKIDCSKLEPSDYKKIGAKLKELVPCALLSFDDGQILIWRGKDWKSMYSLPPLVVSLPEVGIARNLENSGDSEDDQTIMPSSPKMTSLWKRAIKSSKALLLDEIIDDPDALLEKVEEFEVASQANEHSSPALIFSSEDGDATTAKGSIADFEEDNTYPSDGFTSEEEDDDDEDYLDDNNDEYEPATPGSLPIDRIVDRLRNKTR